MDQKTIPNASYVMYDSPMDGVPSSHAMPGQSRWAMFYAADGTQLAKLEHGNKFVEAMLDAKAPKPQPNSCVIAFHKTIKGASGWRANFYDVHQNLVQWHWYDEQKRCVLVHNGWQYQEFVLNWDKKTVAPAETFPLDLTKLQSIVQTEAPSASWCVII